MINNIEEDSSIYLIEEKRKTSLKDKGQNKILYKITDFTLYIRNGNEIEVNEGQIIEDQLIEDINNQLKTFSFSCEDKKEFISWGSVFNLFILIKGETRNFILKQLYALEYIDTERIVKGKFKEIEECTEINYI